jgi:Lanthionine synthetase C-like protein
MLVGRCGYVLGIKWLQRQINNEIIPPSEMRKMVRIMIKSGKNYAAKHKLKIPLMYQYHGREYLGAAHGISAILFAMLDTELDDIDMIDVRASIDAILDLQDESGNFPSKFDKNESHLVHW